MPQPLPSYATGYPRRISNPYAGTGADIQDYRTKNIVSDRAAGVPAHPLKPGAYSPMPNVTVVANADGTFALRLVVGTHHGPKTREYPFDKQNSVEFPAVRAASGAVTTPKVRYMIDPKTSLFIQVTGEPLAGHSQMKKFRL